jgi:hypothetical protein
LDKSLKLASKIGAKSWKTDRKNKQRGKASRFGAVANQNA